MTKAAVFYGFVVAIILAILGCYLFLLWFTDYTFLAGLQIIKSQGNLGKIVALGSILDLLAFGILLQLKQEMMARGVVLAVICITILTLFL